MPNFLSRIFKPSAVKAAEGEPRPGPYWLPVSGGWLSQQAGQFMNWWQLGYNVEGSGTRSAIVEACVSAYAQTVAMCPGDHWRAQDNGGRERVTNSALSRILKKPNSYQSISDFLMNAVRGLYLDGNAYAVALRNDRYEIDSLHLMNPRQSYPMIAATGEIFYALSGNEIVEKMLMQAQQSLTVPARDVLHIRLASPRHPLRGESPLVSAAFDIAAGDAMLAQQIQFYANQARPGFVLTTDMVLSEEEAEALRQRWNQQAAGMNAGGTPILSSGLKPQVLSAKAEDSQLADIMKMTNEHIALAFRIPMQILGIGGGAPMGSTEALMNGWLASSLGFCLNHVESAFDRLFALKGVPDEYTEFNTASLLRSAFKDRMDGLAKAVQGSILAPNEARALEDYKAVKSGDMPRAQQQLVPLDAAEQIQAAPPAPPAPPAPAKPPVPAKDYADAVQHVARSLIAAADGFDSRPQ